MIDISPLHRACTTSLRPRTYPPSPPLHHLHASNFSGNIPNLHTYSPPSLLARHLSPPIRPHCGYSDKAFPSCRCAVLFTQCLMFSGIFTREICLDSVQRRAVPHRACMGRVGPGRGVLCVGSRISLRQGNFFGHWGGCRAVGTGGPHLVGRRASGASWVGLGWGCGARWGGVDWGDRWVVVGTGRCISIQWKECSGGILQSWCFQLMVRKSWSTTMQLTILNYL